MGTAIGYSVNSMKKGTALPFLFLILVPFSAEKGAGKDEMLRLLNTACEEWKQAE